MHISPTPATSERLPVSNGFNYYSEPEPFHGTTVVEIPVPSGRLIATDNLRRAPYFDVKPRQSINYGAGLDLWTRDYAEQKQVAQVFVGNSCPSVMRRRDGSLSVVSPAWDEGDDKPALEDGEVVVAGICTDLWSTMMVDYESWLKHGGEDISTVNDKFAVQVFTVIDVEPGLYRWTTFSADDDFDIHAMGRIVYATLERIGDVVPTE